MRLGAVLLLCAGAVWGQSATPEQLFREAVAAQQRGDDAQAVRKYQELLKLRPDVMEVRANLGAALAQLGRYDEAIAQYEAALSKDESNAALRLNLALAYYKKNDFSGAARQLSRLHAAEPSNLQVALLLGDCESRLGHFDRVTTLLEPLEAANAGNLTLGWLLGSALIRTGHTEKGLDRVESVARRGNSADAWLLAGRTALQLSQFERARDDANAAFRLNPKLPGLLTLRGQVMQYLGDNQGAQAVLLQAIAENPNDFDAQLTIGAVFLSLRDLDSSEQHLKRALELDPRSTLARYEMARLDRIQGRLEAAAKNLEQVVKDDPNWPQPHVELAAVYFRLKRLDEGRRERAIFDRLNANPMKLPPRLPLPPENGP